MSMGIMYICTQMYASYAHTYTQTHTFPHKLFHGEMCLGNDGFIKTQSNSLLHNIAETLLGQYSL